GLDRFEARPAVVRALREDGRIVAEKRPYVHSVGHCSRCGTTVEPRQSLQWFVRVGPLAKAAGDAVRDGRVRLHPPEMNARYFGWVDDMHDWCISRQLWWGHRIPVYYGPNGQVVCVGPDEQPPAGWTQDPDVLDTWFSSGLWPFSTLGRGANPGGDIAISEEWAAGSRNFSNKLWNAVRFALLNGAHVPAAPAPVSNPTSPTSPIGPTSRTSYSVPDRWILSRLSSV